MKVCLIVLAGLLSMQLFAKRSAALRHWVLATTMLCALLLPALEMLLPAWHVPVSNEVGASSSSQATSVEEAFSLPVAPVAAGSHSPAAFRGVLQMIWITGSGISLAVLFAGLGRLGWLASRARRVSDQSWNSLVGPVRLLQSDHPTLLVTWGFVRPNIILPVSARSWSEARMRVVLWHELAHIQRRDWVVQMTAEFVRAIYWFNPLIWMACRRLRLESERACDDVVLNRGLDGPEYAAELIGLVRDLKAHQTWLPAPAMARPSSLKRRVAAMLNTHINRQPMTGLARVAVVLALLVITIPIAAAQTFATFSGSVVDAQGLPLPDASLVLSNAQRHSKYEVRSSATGTFEFVGLPAGLYTFDVQVSGFATHHETVSIAAGQNLQRALTLKVGSLQETINIVGDKEGPSPKAYEARPFQPEDMSGCVAMPVGGNIKAPRKLKDMPPQYPASLRGTGTEGVVVLDTTIGVDGFVKNIEVRDGANPDLADAAVTAVREWRYTQTILNCTPIEVQMTVTAHFRQAR
jgi:TonB family protein